MVRDRKRRGGGEGESGRVGGVLRNWLNGTPRERKKNTRPRWSSDPERKKPSTPPTTSCCCCLSLVEKSLYTLVCYPSSIFSVVLLQFLFFSFGFFFYHFFLPRVMLEEERFTCDASASRPMPQSTRHSFYIRLGKGGMAQSRASEFFYGRERNTILISFYIVEKNFWNK
jgi:hypothetical protein